MSQRQLVLTLSLVFVMSFEPGLYLQISQNASEGSAPAFTPKHIMGLSDAYVVSIRTAL